MTPTPEAIGKKIAALERLAANHAATEGEKLAATKAAAALRRKYPDAVFPEPDDDAGADEKDDFAWRPPPRRARRRWHGPTSEEQAKQDREVHDWHESDWNDLGCPYHGVYVEGCARCSIWREHVRSAKGEARQEAPKAAPMDEKEPVHPQRCYQGYGLGCVHCMRIASWRRQMGRGGGSQ